MLDYLHDYAVEVRNRFQGLDLIECLMNYGQRFHCRGDNGHCTGDRDQDHPHGKEMQKSKMVEEALQIAVKRREKQRRKGKIYPFECKVPKTSKER